MAITYRASEIRLSITQGVGFHRELELAYDRYTGLPFDFTGWTAALVVVDEKNVTVLEFATTGEAGVITLGSDGTIDLDLAAGYTTSLAASREVAGVIHAPLYGDLVLTSPEDDPFLAARAVIEIRKAPGS
jgi:hypothetical protein